MTKYLFKRILTGLLTVVAVFVINFTLVKIAPGDPITILAGNDNPSPELIATIKAQYGLDKSIPEQMWVYTKNILKGDMGYSYIAGRPVFDIIIEKLWPTLLLSLTGAVLSLIIGTFFGLIASQHPDTLLDNVLSYISYVLYSMPAFWLGLIMILVFASWLRVLPTSGMINVRANYTGLRYALDVAKHLILPAGTLALIGIPTYFRITKASMSQVSKDDYAQLFRSTGMEEKRIYRKYLFRNAILPTITTFGIRLAYVIGGSAALEIVFAWPGMGRLVLSSIQSRDYPVLMGIYIIISVSVAVWMILVDCLYAVADPRIRLS